MLSLREMDVFLVIEGTFMRNQTTLSKELEIFLDIISCWEFEVIFTKPNHMFIS